MLDIALLRKDIAAVAARLKSRSFDLDIEAFNAIESERRSVQMRTEELQAQPGLNRMLWLGEYLVCAGRFLTRLPLPDAGPLDGPVLGRAVLCYPLVGLVIGGLLISTLITLFLVPVVYSIFDDWKESARRRLRPRSRSRPRRWRTEPRSRTC